MKKDSSSNKEDITNNITNNSLRDTDVADKENNDLVQKIIDYEQDTMSDEDIPAFFQHLINTGQAWELQGHYGRMAKYLIDIGVCNEVVPRNE